MKVAKTAVFSYFLSFFPVIPITSFQMGISAKLRGKIIGLWKIRAASKKKKIF